MKEQRPSTMSRTRRGARILFYSDASELTCIVRNLSEKGACLEIANPGRAIPRVFELKIVGENDVRSCKAIWEADKWIGVSFHRLRPVKFSGESEAKAVRAKSAKGSRAAVAMDGAAASKTAAE